MYTQRKGKNALLRPEGVRGLKKKKKVKQKESKYLHSKTQESGTSSLAAGESRAVVLIRAAH